MNELPYFVALVLGVFVPYFVARHEVWELGLDLPVGKRVSRSIRWGVIYAIVSYAFCIDMAHAPIDTDWGIAILTCSVWFAAIWTWVHWHGTPEWLGGEDG